MIKKIITIVMGAFYVFAGAIHFINPEFYYPLIPDYLPFHGFINYASGILEVLLGLGLFINKFRSKAALGIIILLILFIPAHIYFIQKGNLPIGNLTITPTIAWIRLLVVHPLLMYWAYVVSKD